jgi:hypothetical protein
MRKHRRLTRLEIKLLGQKLAVADIIATDNDFALAAKALIGGYLHAASLGRDLHQEDIVRVIEEAFRITEYRLENLDSATRPRQDRGTRTAAGDQQASERCRGHVTWGA